MEILELKNGSVDVNDIETYNNLKRKLDFIRERLNCTTSTRFKKEFFRIGDYGNSAYENKDYIILASNRSNTDEKQKQEINNFLTVNLIKQIKEIIKILNVLIILL